MAFYDMNHRERIVFIRALDAIVALMNQPLTDASRRAIIRLLAALFDAGPAGTGDTASETRMGRRSSPRPPPPGPCRTRPGPAVDPRRTRDHVRTTEMLAEWPAKHPCWKLHTLGVLPRRLVLLTNAQGLKVSALATRAGLPAPRVRSWLSGAGRPDADARHTLAKALGIHTGWLAPERDEHVDPVYRFRHGGPCDAATSFTLDWLDPDPMGAASTDRGWWCDGCGQPYLADTTGRLYPAPLFVRDERHPYPAVDPTTDLSHPWPHALWVAEPDPQRTGGSYRLPLSYEHIPS
ncbi:helix-turn-helix domain-containing protein [Streptomyces sp. 8N706]|uniref:helix-turn-helix domain-containing protein n=1 Tax=Streptomyces sp. 8N706 TaxID=3457416 RepID=UPI003FD56B8E